MAVNTEAAPATMENAKPPSVLKMMNAMMGILAEQPRLTTELRFPKSRFARALKLDNGIRIPQAIAHRGYKAAYPENTMAAFIGAVDVGAHALETDIHLTKDDIVVLSHDKDLKRCFGRPEKLIDCNWDTISKFRTISEPIQAMPRLEDLLKYVARPGLEHIWVLLDIKLDNDATNVMRLIASTIASVPPSKLKAWKDRIVLGIWAAKFLPLCHEFLPEYSVSNIGFTTMYAQQFFKVPNISFNMLQGVLHGPIGASFIKKAKREDRPVFAWTVNDENRMRWCIRKELDGVISDDPKKFLAVCKDYEELPLEKGIKGKERFAPKDWLQVLRIQVLVAVFVVLFRVKFGWPAEQKAVSKGSKIQEEFLGRTVAR